jgi:hypothetical protein
MDGIPSTPNSILRMIPSFPRAFSGNPGEIRTGPPIKTFGGDDFWESHSHPQPNFQRRRRVRRGLFKMLFLFDFLRALRASAVQSPSPASHESLRTPKGKARYERGTKGSP